MDNGLPGVGHVGDDAVGEDQEDEVLLGVTGGQMTVGTGRWGRQGQYQLCTRAASPRPDHSNRADRL